VRSFILVESGLGRGEKRIVCWWRYGDVDFGVVKLGSEDFRTFPALDFKRGVL
jgi:hypothetical protein